MILSGFKTRDSNIVFGVDTISHEAVVEVAGEFPIGKLKRARQDPKINKYKKDFDEVFDKYPDGKLPVGAQFRNYCIASCVALGIRTSNANVDMVNANGEKIGLYLGSSAKDFVGKTTPVITAIPVVQPPQPPSKPKPRTLDAWRKTLEKQQQSISNTRQTAQRHVRVGQHSWANTVRAESPQCIITGNSKPNALEAAHIKPHAQFPEREVALNLDNGFMVVRSLHPAFDVGEWSLNENGAVILSSHLSQEDIANLAKLGLTSGLTVSQNVFSTKSEYFAWHRENVFKK